jgi:MFS-type transporter involved in bile tolerance (Atg22 family)
MKLLIMFFLFLGIFVLTGSAFAMHQLGALQTLSEPFAMLLFGTLLTGMGSLSRKYCAFKLEKRENLKD